MVTLRRPPLFSSSILAHGASTATWCPCVLLTQLENFSSMGLSWARASPAHDQSRPRVRATIFAERLIQISFVNARGSRHTPHVARSAPTLSQVPRADLDRTRWPPHSFPCSREVRPPRRSPPAEVHDAPSSSIPRPILRL